LIWWDSRRRGVICCCRAEARLSVEVTQSFWSWTERPSLRTGQQEQKDLQPMLLPYHHPADPMNAVWLSVATASGILTAVLAGGPRLIGELTIRRLALTAARSRDPRERKAARRTLKALAPDRTGSAGADATSLERSVGGPSVEAPGSQAAATASRP
jgi:hypothetical protein